MLSTPLARLRTHIAAAVFGAAIIATAGTAVMAQTKDIKIEFSSSAVDANWVAMIDAMKGRIEQLNKEGRNITLNVSDAGLNVDKQISDVQTAAVKQPSIMLIDPVDPAGIKPAVEQVKAAGIKLFNIRPDPSDPEGLYDGDFVLSFENNYAQNITKWIEGLLAADPKLVIKVGILYGGAAQQAQLLRGDVIKTIAAAHPDRVQVVAEKYADWSLEIAQNTTSDFITAHPDLNMIVAANQQMGLGAANAIESAGKTGQIWVAGYDIDAPTVQRILDGTIAFTSGVQFKTIGEAILNAAVDIVDGTYSGELTFDPIYAVTKDNAAEVLAELTK